MPKKNQNIPPTNEKISSPEEAKNVSINNTSEQTLHIQDSSVKNKILQVVSNSEIIDFCKKYDIDTIIQNGYDVGLQKNENGDIVTKVKKGQESEILRVKQFFLDIYNSGKFGYLCHIIKCLAGETPEKDMVKILEEWEKTSYNLQHGDLYKRIEKTPFQEKEQDVLSSASSSVKAFLKYLQSDGDQMDISQMDDFMRQYIADNKNISQKENYKKCIEEVFRKRKKMMFLRQKYMYLDCDAQTLTLLEGEQRNEKNTGHYVEFIDHVAYGFSSYPIILDSYDRKIRSYAEVALKKGYNSESNKNITTEILIDKNIYGISYDRESIEKKDVKGLTFQKRGKSHSKYGYMLEMMREIHEKNSHYKYLYFAYDIEKENEKVNHELASSLQNKPYKSKLLEYRYKDRFWYKGMSFIENQDYDNVISLAENELKNNKYCIDALSLITECYRKKKNFQKAGEYYAQLASVMGNREDKKYVKPEWQEITAYFEEKFDTLSQKNEKYAYAKILRVISANKGKWNAYYSAYKDLFEKPKQLPVKKFLEKNLYNVSACLDESKKYEDQNRMDNAYLCFFAAWSNVKEKIVKLNLESSTYSGNIILHLISIVEFIKSHPKIVNQYKWKKEQKEMEQILHNSKEIEHYLQKFFEIIKKDPKRTSVHSTFHNLVNFIDTKSAYNELENLYIHYGQEIPKNRQVFGKISKKIRKNFQKFLHTWK